MSDKKFKKNKNPMKNKNVISSIRFALEGLIHVLKTERNFKIHLCFVILLIILSLILKISFTEVAILSITCTMVLFAEVINTAIEAVVDLYCKEEFRHLGKIAKDCSAGAVLITAINAVIVGVVIFFNKIF